MDLELKLQPTEKLKKQDRELEIKVDTYPEFRIHCPASSRAYLAALG